MADKIYNINDYKKEDQAGDAPSDNNVNVSPGSDENVNSDTADNNTGMTSDKLSLELGYTKPEDISAEDIQIEDPLNFLTAQEKEQYILAHSDTIIGSHAPEDNYDKAPAADYNYNNSQNYNEQPYNGNDYYPQDNGYMNMDGEAPDMPYPSDGYYDNDGYYMPDNYPDAADLEELEEEEDDFSPVLYYLPRILAAIACLFAAFIVIMLIKRAIPSISPSDEDRAETVSEEEEEENQEEEEEEAGESLPQGTIVHTTSGLNLRTSPEKADNIGQTVQSGTELILVGEENGWAKVWYDGQYYFCSKSYIQ